VRCVFSSGKAARLHSFFVYTAKVKTRLGVELWIGLKKADATRLLNSCK
jgi:hypothetical protein